MSYFWFFGALGLYCIVMHFAISKARERDYNVGYEDGHKAGCAFAFDEGYVKGFEVGHISAEQWWADAEVAVQSEREKIWREE